MQMQKAEDALAKMFYCFDMSAYILFFYLHIKAHKHNI